MIYKLEAQMRLLRHLNSKGLINLDNYYVVSLSDKIRLQGKLTSISILDIKNLDLDINIVNDWLEGSSKNIVISLIP